MLPKIKKILYATDLSQNSAHAMRYALNFAQQLDAVIVILHVIDNIPEPIQKIISSHLAMESMESLYSESVSIIIKQVENRAKVFCEKELNNDPEPQKRITSVEVCEGAPAAKILEKADELACDMIVLGTHGKGFIQETFLGSTARKIIKGSRIPVFVIPLPEGDIDLSFNWSQDIEEKH